MAKLHREGLITDEEIWWVRVVGLCYTMGWTIDEVENMSVEKIEKTIAVLEGMRNIEPKETKNMLK